MPFFLTAKTCSVGDAWAKYVPEFNRMDDELYANAVSNSAAEAFLRENAPSFSCPDEEIERIYHFRWWTYRKHLRKSSSGGWNNWGGTLWNNWGGTLKRVRISLVNRVVL